MVKRGSDTLGETLAPPLVAFLVVVVVILGLFLFRGIESGEFFQKSIFYFTLLSISIIGLLSLGFIQYFVQIGILSYEKWGWANVYIFNPKESIFGETPLRKYLTLTNIFHFSIIFATIVALYGTVTQTSFVGLPATEFQVSETGQIILSAEPASISETLFIGLILSLFYGLGLWFIQKNKLPKSTRYLLYLVIPLLVMVVWVAMHTARYGTQQTALSAVAAFGYIGAVITFLTGSIITFAITHDFNNIFLKASKLFSSQSVIATILTFLGIYIIFIVLTKLIGRRKNGQKK